VGSSSLLLASVATLGTAFASALLPIINIEAFLIALEAARGPGTAWWFALVATVGQMVGKVLIFAAGRGALRLPAFAGRKTRPGKRWDLSRVQQRLSQHPGKAGWFVFLSAAVGIPPFAIVSLLAGVAGMRLSTFVVAGSVGRYLRFLGFALLPAVTGWHFG
jgi:membrane protein YqaA with SNARE-associated domain